MKCFQKCPSKISKPIFHLLINQTYDSIFSYNILNKQVMTPHLTTFFVVSTALNYIICIEFMVKITANLVKSKLNIQLIISQLQQHLKLLGNLINKSSRAYQFQKTTKQEWLNSKEKSKQINIIVISIWIVEPFPYLTASKSWTYS